MVIMIPCLKSSAAKKIAVRWLSLIAEKSRILGPQAITCAVKIAAAAAEVRAILVHSGLEANVQSRLEIISGVSVRCLESQFAVHNDSNRLRCATNSNRTIRIARPKTVRIAVKALPFLHFKKGFKSAIRFASDLNSAIRDSNRARNRSTQSDIVSRFWFQVVERSDCPTPF